MRGWTDIFGNWCGADLRCGSIVYDVNGNDFFCLQQKKKKKKVSEDLFYITYRHIIINFINQNYWVFVFVFVFDFFF